MWQCKKHGEKCKRGTDKQYNIATEIVERKLDYPKAMRGEGEIMSGFIMQPESIAAMLRANNPKTMTRRLVKEGERDGEVGGSKGYVPCVYTNKNKKIKWQVGKSYAVQSGRGKPTVWYCPYCVKHNTKGNADVDFEINKIFDVSGNFNKLAHPELYECFQCGMPWKPLRILITGIKKERLLDISEEDAKKEGFERIMIHPNVFGKNHEYDSARTNFLRVFWQLNKKPKEDLSGTLGFGAWNPFVWVISFCLEE